MKLRAFVIFLLVLNGALWCWGQGWLALWGLQPRPAEANSPIQTELHPERMRLVLDSNAKHLTQLSNPTLCLQSSFLAPAVANHIEAQFDKQLPAGSWQRQDINTPGKWMLYLGRYQNNAALEKKQEELRRLRISNTQEPPADYQPGIALAFYDSPDKLEVELAQLQKRGVRGIQTVTLSQPINGAYLRIDAADDALREKLLQLYPTLQGQEFSPCP